MTDSGRDRPPDRTDPPPVHSIWTAWSTLRLAMMAVLWCAANLVAQTLTYTYTGDMFAAVGAGGLLVIALAGLVVKGQGGTLARDFDLDRPLPGTALLAILASVAALLPTSYLAGLSSAIHPPTAEWLAFYNEHLPDTAPRVAVAVAAVVVCGPVAEELVFRGLVYRIGRRHWGVLPSALISALIFGLAHGEPWYFFGLVGLGLLYAHIYERTGSLTACILAHAAHNGMSLAIMLSQDSASGDGLADLPIDWFGLAGSLFALIAIIFLYSRRR